MLNLKNLKSLFVLEETEDNSNQTENTPQQGSAKKQSGSSVSGAGELDVRITNSLLKAMEDNNIAGFDYLEFKNSLKAMAAMQLDEATRFRSAFATASTMGVTVNKLLDNIEFYKKVLSTERDRFSRTLQDQVSENVISKERQIDSLNESIKKKSEEISRLTQEINKHQTDAASLKANIIDAKGKIEKTKINFQMSYDNLISQFNDDAGKIKSYLS